MTKPITRSESTAFLNPMNLSVFEKTKPEMFPTLSKDEMDESIREWNLNKKRKGLMYEYVCRICQIRIKMNPLRNDETLEVKDVFYKHRECH